jgi:biotin transport system substrate-specific component
MRVAALTRITEQAATASLGREMALVGLAAAATALSAHVRLPLPFTPVPVTLQTCMVLVAGGLLGARLGMTSQLVYLVLASVGLPVVAGPTLFGPTGGYLIGFVAAAAVMGHAAARGDWRWLAGGAVLASLAIYACGVTWLCLVTDQGLRTGVALGVIPFVGGDVLKALAALGAIAAGRPIVGRLLRR